MPRLRKRGLENCQKQLIFQRSRVMQIFDLPVLIKIEKSLAIDSHSGEWDRIIHTNKGLNNKLGFYQRRQYENSRSDIGICVPCGLLR